MQDAEEDEEAKPLFVNRTLIPGCGILFLSGELTLEQQIQMIEFIQNGGLEDDS